MGQKEGNQNKEEGGEEEGKVMHTRRLNVPACWEPAQEFWGSARFDPRCVLESHAFI